MLSQSEEDLLSTWWKEYAECSEGPRGQPGLWSKLNEEGEKSSLENESEEERVGVPVKGGLYEVYYLTVILLVWGHGCSEVDFK